jgi:hypothetical protein
MTGIVSGVGRILGLSSPKRPAPVPIVSRDDAAIAADVERDLRKRRGSAADMLLGPMGAEAPTTPAKILTGQ